MEPPLINHLPGEICGASLPGFCQAGWPGGTSRALVETFSTTAAFSSLHRGPRRIIAGAPIVGRRPSARRHGRPVDGRAARSCLQQVQRLFHEIPREIRSRRADFCRPCQVGARGERTVDVAWTLLLGVRQAGRETRDLRRPAKTCEDLRDLEACGSTAETSQRSDAVQTICLD